MTTHPAARCTKSQIAAFERIAIGDDTCIHPQTATALIKRGLIECTEEFLRARFLIIVYRYHVPFSVHRQWCEWCDENVPDAEAVERLSEQAEIPL